MGEIVKILQINATNFGSTGNIMINISKKTEKNSYNSYIAYANSRTNKIKTINNSLLIGTILERNIHLKLAYYTGLNGCFSKIGTRNFLKQVDAIKPDIIHLHNLHNCYINLEMLFNYIKDKEIPVVWTLHDCWAFTGQCPHYTIVNCYKWKVGCYECPQYKQYPASRVDKTKKMYKLKKSWFTGVKDLSIVTPSKWLKSQVEKSFLNEYPVKMINNGIDLSLFRPIKSDFREKYGIKDKIMLLGVANPWSKKKGLDVFIELSKILNQSYKIVLVGLTYQQIELLPDRILGLPKTNNQSELAEIYTTADYLLNPSLEETMGLVTIEALACGTPVIVSDSTAVAEVVNEKCGEIVKGNESGDYFNTLTNLKKEYTEKNCLIQAKKYHMHIKYKEYMDLYSQIIKD